MQETKKIALITYTPFWQRGSGCQRRIDGLVQLLEECGAELDLLYVEHQKALSGNDIKQIEKEYEFASIYQLKLSHQLLRILKRINNVKSNARYFDRVPDTKVTRQVKSILNEKLYDAVIVEYADLGYVLDNLNCNPVKIVDTHNVLHHHQASFASRKLKGRLEILPEEEANALNRFDVIIAINDEENAVFRKMCPEKNVITLLPWMEVEAVPIEETEKQNVLFLGSGISPNVHGIIEFIDKSWPLVLDKVPKAELIIGGDVGRFVDISRCRNVECLGRIHDVDEFYKSGYITINPVIVGNGLKIKSLEALSKGRICIGYPHSAAGLKAFMGKGLFVADNPQDFATLIVEFLQDKDLCVRKASEALKTAGEVLSPSSCVMPLLDKIGMSL